MTAPPQALDFVLALSRAHAGVVLRMREDLGAFPGPDFGDLTLLYLLGRRNDGRLPTNDLARLLGLSVSELVRRIVLLEKTGFAERVPEPAIATQRQVMLRPGGRQLLRSAIATVEAHCKAHLHEILASDLASTHATLLRMSAYIEPDA